MATGIGSPIANVLVPATGAVPDLTVSMTDSGSGVFHAGDVGDTFTITVTNSGGAATSGTVSLADTLPSGLTATSLSGSGWTINGLTATRSDALAAGSSYSALTLTVDVASNTSGNVTNTATVSGGGETNTSNDTATDTVTIEPPPDLTVSMADSGNFQQGDAGDTYTITVTNSGAGADQRHGEPGRYLARGTDGHGFSGSGWTVNGLTATNSSVVAAGSSYAAADADGQRGGKLPGQRDQHGHRFRRRRAEHLQRHGHRHQQRRGGHPGHYRHHALAFRRHGHGRADLAGRSTSARP